jgi:NMD protein affecting ribosome stability and mRNA decay
MAEMRFVVLALSAVVCLDAEVRLGLPLSQSEPQTVSSVLRDAATLEGKVVQVKGKVTEVCQRMGCWMNLVDPASGESIRIKVNDGEIVFPKDAPGRMAVAEGKLKKLVLSREQAIAMARHEAEEQGRKFDPASIKTGKTIYQIQGTGAVLLD